MVNSSSFTFYKKKTQIHHPFPRKSNHRANIGRHGLFGDNVVVLWHRRPLLVGIFVKFRQCWIMFGEWVRFLFLFDVASSLFIKRSIFQVGCTVNKQLLLSNRICYKSSRVWIEIDRGISTLKSSSRHSAMAHACPSIRIPAESWLECSIEMDLIR